MSSHHNPDCRQESDDLGSHQSQNSVISRLSSLRHTLFSRLRSRTSASAAYEMPQYTSREMGDPSQIRRTRQSMADLKLRRLTELNNRLREDLDRERIPVSTAAKR